jgi:hypothetical protein
LRRRAGRALGATSDDQRLFEIAKLVDFTPQLGDARSSLLDRKRVTCDVWKLVTARARARVMGS